MKMKPVSMVAIVNKYGRSLERGGGVPLGPPQKCVISHGGSHTCILWGHTGMTGWDVRTSCAEWLLVQREEYLTHSLARVPMNRWLELHLNKVSEFISICFHFANALHQAPQRTFIN